MILSLIRQLILTALLAGLLSTLAYSQDHSASETIRIHEIGGRQVVTKATGVCPDQVAQGDTALTFEGTFRTGSPNPTDYEVEFTYGGTDGSAKVEGIEPTTNIGAWETTSDEDGGTASLRVGVSAAQDLAWTFGLFMAAPGLAFYTWQIRVAGNLQRDDSCTFEIILLPGRIVGQVFVEFLEEAVGLDDVEVTLIDANGDSVASTITRPVELDGVDGFHPATERGWYFFNGVIPGKYTLRLRLRDTYEPASPEDDEPEVDVPPDEEVNRDITTVPINGLDWGDLPRSHPDDNARCPFQGGPFRCYQTLTVDDGARHGINQQVGLGPTIPDAETDGQPVTDAAADDSTGYDDEDAIRFLFIPAGGGASEIQIEAHNRTEDRAFLDGWFDFNNNGRLENVPEEHVISQGVLAQSSDVITIKFNAPSTLGGVYFRLRITTAASAGFAPRPFGLFFDGEVEDHLFKGPFGDFGDAPDEPDPSRPDIPAGYPTRFQDDGARHPLAPSASPEQAEGIFLGRRIDPDGDGQPTLAADGDDRDSGQANDDDGIVFGDGFTPIRATGRPGARQMAQFVYGVAPGDSATIIPLATVDGLLDAWFDWNRNGQWEENERVFRNESTLEQPNVRQLRFRVPPEADEGYTFARFRYRVQGDVEVTGLALNGEVEDYLLKVIRPIEIATAADSGPGSLRQALLDANQAEGIQQISLAGLARPNSKGADPILLESPLPEITDPVVIDGGGTAIIDGSGAGADANGLVISAAGTVVSGLTVQNFARRGILVSNETNGGDDLGPVAVHDNTITGNGGAGIRVSVESARPGPTISANRIFDNGGLAIDHSGLGVTDNAENDGLAFPDFPVVTSVVSGSTTIEGTYSGLTDTTYVLDFFASTRCDGSGHGEAEFYVGSTSIVTDADGNAEFSVEFETTIANRHQITATATGPDGTTSELSQCTAAVGVERTESVDVPTAFQLDQNYPNPFNPTTTISFEVAERALVRLDVFNTLGRVVETTVDEILAPGRYQATFDAGRLPSGVYYYRLRAGSFVETKAMILMK